MVPFLSLAVACILAGKHFGCFFRAVIVVVAQSAAQKPFLVAVEMLVIEVAAQFFHPWLQQVEVPSL